MGVADLMVPVAVAEFVHPPFGALAEPAEPGLVEAGERVGGFRVGEGFGPVVAGEGFVAGLAAVFAVARPAVACFERAAAGVVAEAFSGHWRPFGFDELAERRGELAGVPTPRQWVPLWLARCSRPSASRGRRTLQSAT